MSANRSRVYPAYISADAPYRVLAVAEAPT
jgi:hypothetical protein